MEETKLDHITLRPFNPSDPSDVDAYFAWASDDKVTRFSSYETFTSKDDLLRFLTEAILPHPWYRAICLDGRPVGAISLTPAGWGDWHRAELGYVLAWEHWGKGIATAAVRKALLAVAKEMAGLERVEALAEVENVASQKVLEKAGFVREGVLRKYWMLKGRPRDMVIFSYLFTDGLRQKEADEQQCLEVGFVEQLSIHRNCDLPSLCTSSASPSLATS